MFARDTSWNRSSLFAYILHVVAVGALAVAWVAIGLGLYSEPGSDPRFEIVAACFALAAAFAAAFLHLYGNRSGRTRAASIRGGAVLVVAILVGAVVTIPPLIAGSGTPSGVLARLVTNPHCGRNLSDWTDEGQTTVYTGGATQSYPPKNVPDNVFGVVVTLHNGTGSVETTPPTAISFRDELPLQSGPPGTQVMLYQPGTGNEFAFTHLRAPNCEAGSSRVVSATYEYADYGGTSTSRIQGTVSRSG